MSINSRSDWHLADALSEDILNTGAEDLFGEVAEDHQDRRALATEFDRIFDRGLRRVRSQELKERLKQLIDLPWPAPRFATASIGALAAIAIVSALYFDQSFTPAERQPINLTNHFASLTPQFVVVEAPKVAPEALNARSPAAASLLDLPAPAPEAATAAGAPPITTAAELERAEPAPRVAQSEGLRKANRSVASLTAESLTVAPDAVRGRDMFAYAASYFGDADAQYQLGRLYLDGSTSDPRQAARWFQLAATKGDCRAEAVLGDMLFQGQHVPRQAARGLMWLTLARDCVDTEEDDWIKPLYENAFRRANDDERAMALVFLENWLKGRRDWEYYPQNFLGFVRLACLVILFRRF